MPDFEVKNKKKKFVKPLKTEKMTKKQIIAIPVEDLIVLTCPSCGQVIYYTGGIVTELKSLKK